MQTRTETITAPDGNTFDAHLVLPESGNGPGILVLQEIFGVNGYIRDVCERLAALGYVAMAPDVFWRIEPNVQLGHDDESMKKAFGYISQYDWQKGIPDLGAALVHLSIPVHTALFPAGGSGAGADAGGGVMSIRRPAERRRSRYGW